MESPLPTTAHELSISFNDEPYDCVVTTHAIPVFSYYALVVVFDMEPKFFNDFDVEDVFLNQYYPVQNRESTISNIKALEENVDWLIEQAYRAFEEAEWTLSPPPE